MLYEAFQRTVKKHVIASSRRYVKLLIRYEIMYVISVATCRIDHSAGIVCYIRSLNGPAITIPDDICYLGIELEFNTILRCTFSQSDIKSKRTDDTSCRSIKRADCVI